MTDTSQLVTNALFNNLLFSADWFQDYMHSIGISIKPVPYIWEYLDKDFHFRVRYAPNKKYCLKVTWQVGDLDIDMDPPEWPPRQL
jgi:hypothetical protein